MGAVRARGKAGAVRLPAGVRRTEKAGRIDPGQQGIAVAQNKTRPGGEDVDAFLDAVEDPARREDAKAVCALMARVTGEPPVLWGGSMVGFGRYRYRYGSGREGEWFVTGFAPRAGALSLYIMGGFPRHQALMDRLGRYRTGKSCLYVKRLTDVDAAVLEQLLTESVAYMRDAYPSG